MNPARRLASGRGHLIRRVLGTALVVFSALGLVISMLGLVAVCRFSGRVASSADQALEVTLSALTSTRQNLELASSALEEAQVALGAAQTFVDESGSGLENTSALLESMSDILLADLPEVIEETQHSLSAAEEGAAVIEDVLYGLNAISGLTGLAYDPEVSLTESFARMNESLDAIPATLSELDESLKASQENLDHLQIAISEVSGPLDESGAVLAESQASVEAYSSIIEGLTLDVRHLQETLPSLMRIAVFALCFLLIWLAVSQIGLLWQGWEMIRYDPSLVEQRVRELEERVQRLVKQRRK
jgi:prophage DNA circulation protein